MEQVCSFLTLTIGSFTKSVMLMESLLDRPTHELMSVPSVMMIINIRMSVSRVLRDPPKPFHVMDIGHIGFDVGTSRLDVVRVESAAAQGSGVTMLVHAVAYRVRQQFLQLFD